MFELPTSCKKIFLLLCLVPSLSSAQKKPQKEKENSTFPGATTKNGTHDLM
jgi:hypothetical protein